MNELGQKTKLSTNGSTVLIVREALCVNCTACFRELFSAR